MAFFTGIIRIVVFTLDMDAISKERNGISVKSHFEIILSMLEGFG